MLIRQIWEKTRRVRLDHIDDNQRLNDRIPHHDEPLAEIKLAVYVNSETFHVLCREAEDSQWSDYNASEFLQDRKVCGTQVHEVRDPKHPPFRVVKIEV